MSIFIPPRPMGGIGRIGGASSNGLEATIDSPYPASISMFGAEFMRRHPSNYENYQSYQTRMRWTSELICILTRHWRRRNEISHW